MSDQKDYATAHQAWDNRWADEIIRQDWIKPEPLVVDSLPFLVQRNVWTVLDIGCGIGRHAIYLAGHGFEVTGIDLSESGLDTARQTTREAGVAVDYRPGDFTDLPVDANSVDLAIAWNVIYHGDERVVQQAISEIQRVLKPGGLFLGTMISKRHDRYGDGTEVEPNTFIVEDDDEKAHAHFYCNDRELITLLDGFQLFLLQDRQQREPGTWHWEFLAEQIATA
jgi:tellurite methyltransferase